MFAAHYRLVTIRSWSELDAARAGVAAVLARFEQEVSGDFFAGDSPGIVDFAVAPVLYRIRLLERWTGIELTAPYPRVNASVTRISERPSIVKGVAGRLEALHRASLAEIGVLLSRPRV